MDMGDTVVPRCIDIVTNNGIPFRVVYENRVYPSGVISEKPTVAFYDARYAFGPHGQFVADYYVESLQVHDKHKGLYLCGNHKPWTVDAASLRLVWSWLLNVL